jgi:arabinofuranosyltransferase
VLTWSRAFIDFSSSGLENPLAYLCASWFLVSWIRLVDRFEQRDLRAVFASAALLCLTRYDYVVLVAPSLAWAAWLSRKGKGLWRAVLTFAAIVLPWLAFSLVYYGTFLPNAFYAKLTTAIPSHELMGFGLQYLIALIKYDPASVLTIALALGLTASCRDRASWLHVLVGIVGYLGYTVRAGGDFMVGRFISVPVFLCAGLICRSLITYEKKRSSGMFIGLGIGLLATAPCLPILNNYFSPKSMRAAGKKTEIVARVNDEKNAYLGERGLFSGHKGFASWLIGKAKSWSSPHDKSAHRIIQIDCGGLGWLGFEYGPDADVHDTCALADPFISKLPLFEVGQNRRRLPWGPGHFTRSVPEGYQESLASGRNAISDPILAQVYDSTQLIVYGALFDPRRWQAIYDLATLDLVARAQSASTYDGIAHARAQRSYSAPYSEFSRLFRGPCTSVEAAQELEPTDVIDLTFDQPTRAPKMRLSGTPNQPIDVRFLLGEREVGQMSMSPKPRCAFGLGMSESHLPTATADGGFDRVLLRSAEGKPAHIGGVLLQGVGTSLPIVRKAELVLETHACKLLHNRGVETPRCSVYVEPGSSAIGHLMFGPYVPLRRGSYILELDYRIGTTRGARAGQWDVVANDGRGEGVVLARGDLPGTDNVPTTLVGNFWVGTTGRDPAIEVRMWPRERLEAEAFAMRIYRGEPSPASN